MIIERVILGIKGNFNCCSYIVHVVHFTQGLLLLTVPEEQKRIQLSQQTAKFKEKCTLIS